MADIFGLTVIFVWYSKRNVFVEFDCKVLNYRVIKSKKALIFQCVFPKPVENSI